MSLVSLVMLVILIMLLLCVIFCDFEYFGDFGDVVILRILEQGTNDYPDPLLLFERGWPHPPPITYLEAEGVAIPIYFSFCWRTGGRLLHVLYYSVLYRIMPRDQVLHCIIRYYTIL